MPKKWLTSRVILRKTPGCEIIFSDRGTAIRVGKQGFGPNVDRVQSNHFLMTRVTSLKRAFSGWCFRTRLVDARQFLPNPININGMGAEIVLVCQSVDWGSFCMTEGAPPILLILIGWVSISSNKYRYSCIDLASCHSEYASSWDELRHPTTPAEIWPHSSIQFFWSEFRSSLFAHFCMARRSWALRRSVETALLRDRNQEGASDRLICAQCLWDTMPNPSNATHWAWTSFFSPFC